MIRILQTFSILTALVVGINISPAHAFEGVAFPAVEAKNLNMEDVNLPADLDGDHAVLIFSFEQDMAEPSRDWFLALNVAGLPEGVHVYQMPIMPKLFGFIRKKIRKGMAEDVADEVDRNHFIPVFTSRDKFYKAMNISKDEQKDILVVVVNNEGAEVARIRGGNSDENIAAVAAVFAN